MLNVIVFSTILVSCYAQPRIVNGTDAALGEIPYIVSVKFSGNHVCGGSIIDDRHILTACHCINHYPAKKFEIQYGVVNINVNINLIPVKSYSMHPDYDEFNNYANDVAVFELESPIPFSSTVQPVILPEQRVPEGTAAVLAGWGSNYTEGPIITQLQKVDLILFPYETCNEALGSSFNRTYQVCAGVPGGGKGQCTDDSGGPLTVNGTQYGIVSWSIKPCANTYYPGVFANVANYIGWIWEQTN